MNRLDLSLYLVLDPDLCGGPAGMVETARIAAAHGASVDTQIPLSADSSNPVNTNDPALTGRVRASLETALGKDHVREAQRWTASEDFPHFGRSIDAPSVSMHTSITSADLPGIKY